MNLDDGRVAVLGDVHGNASWTSAILAAIHRTAPDVRTVLQVGDFWPDEPYLRIIDRLCEQNGIDQILVTLGNHEPWPIMTPLLAHGRPAHACYWRYNISSPLITIGGSVGRVFVRFCLNPPMVKLWLYDPGIWPHVACIFDVVWCALLRHMWHVVLYSLTEYNASLCKKGSETTHPDDSSKIVALPCDDPHNWQTGIFGARTPRDKATRSRIRVMKHTPH